MKRIEKGGRSLPTSPRLLELVSCLIDIILCVNNLSTLLLLTIVKPYLSTNKQLHYITFILYRLYQLWFNETYIYIYIFLQKQEHCVKKMYTLQKSQHSVLKNS